MCSCSHICACSGYSDCPTTQFNKTNNATKKQYRRDDTECIEIRARHYFIRPNIEIIGIIMNGAVSTPVTTSMNT